MTCKTCNGSGWFTYAGMDWRTGRPQTRPATPADTADDKHLCGCKEG